MLLGDVKYCEDIVLVGETFYMQLFLDWNVLQRKEYIICGGPLSNINKLNLQYISLADITNRNNAKVIYCGLSQQSKKSLAGVVDIDVFNIETINDDGTYIYNNEKFLIDDVKYVVSAPEYMQRAYPLIKNDNLKAYLLELSLAPAGRRVDENGQICLWDYFSKYINQKDGRRVTINFPSDLKQTIHVFGDSRVSGFMLEDKDLFTNILQAKLNEQMFAGGVINYGIPGREIDRMEYQIRKASIRKGDVVFVCTGCYEYRHSALIRQQQFIMHVLSAKKYCDSIGAHFIYINMPTTVEINGPTSDEISITTLYRNYKFKEYTYEIINYYKEFVFLNLQKSGVYCHDIAIDFEKNREDLLFINMHHYSPAGNIIIADYLFQAIRILEMNSFSKEAKKLCDAAKMSNVEYVRKEVKKYSLLCRSRIKLGGWKCFASSEGRFKLKLQLLAFYKDIFAGASNNGAIVMNANPFTLGHRYLVEYASCHSNHLYVIVLEEDKSDISFIDRLKMVYLGCKDIKNVTVLPGGNDVISNETFPEYFLKEELQDKEINAFKDIERFALEVAPRKGIKVRFVGEEPLDNVTKQYNEQMHHYLPRYGIKLVEIPRKVINERTISASNVRKAMHRNDWDTVAKMVPPTTYKYLKQNLAK